MKLTKETLKRIIKEELETVMNESDRFYGKIPQELWAIGDYEEARDEGILDSLRSYSDEELEMKIEQLQEEIDEDPSDPNVYLKEQLIQIIQDILDQGVHQRPMEEGYKGMLYKRNPSLRPPHPSDRREAPDFSTPDMQMKMAISNILMFDAGLRISESGMAAKEIVNNLQEPGFDLVDYLTNTIGIPADQSSEIADKIMVVINQ